MNYNNLIYLTLITDIQLIYYTIVIHVPRY